MFRLVFLLCASMFVTLLVAGEDRGQVRDGLKAAAVAPVSVVAEAVAPVTVADPQPEVAVQPAVARAEDVPAVALAAVEVAPQREPNPPAFTAPEVRILYVDASSVNVRQGPSTASPVTGRLTRDEAVLVVAERGDWVQVRIEGDGVEGYVAARLLREAPQG